MVIQFLEEFAFQRHCHLFEALGTTHLVMECYIPQNVNIQHHCRRNIKTCVGNVVVEQWPRVA